MKNIKSNQISSNYIKLRDSWDKFPNFANAHKERIPYVGRLKDVNKLKHWLLHSGGGSILLSGVRGVGKTAFVNHVLSEIITSYKLVKFLSFIKYRNKLLLTSVIKLILKISNFNINIITINAANIGSAEKQDLLKTLIISFLTSSQVDTEIKAKFEELFNYIQTKVVDKKTQEQSLTTRTDISMSIVWILKKIHIITIFSPLFLLFNNFKDFLTTYGISINLYNWIIYNLLLSMVINTLYTYSSKKRESRIINYVKSESNIDNLYRKLNDFLTNSSDTFIFIIDEIDKLTDINPAKNLDTYILSLKNLFISPSGKFIFITSEKYAYEYIKKIDKKGNYYPLNSTFFNWILFLTAASPNDIQAYLESIGVKNELFTYYVYASSGGVFIKTKNVVRDFIEIIDNHPYLDFGEFTDDHKRIARLGKLLHNVFTQRLSSELADQQTNFIRHELLFAIFQDIISDRKKPEGVATIWDWCQYYSQRGFDKLSRTLQIITASDILSLLNDIKNKGGPEISFEPPQDITSDFEFDFELREIDNNLIGVPDTRNTLALNEIMLTGTINTLTETIQNISKNTGIFTEDVLWLTGKRDSINTYNSSKSLAESLTPIGYTKTEFIIEKTKKIVDLLNEFDKRPKLLKRFLKYSLNKDINITTYQKTNIYEIVPIKNKLTKSLFMDYFLVIEKSKRKKGNNENKKIILYYSDRTIGTNIINSNNLHKFIRISHTENKYIAKDDPNALEEQINLGDFFSNYKNLVNIIRSHLAIKKSYHKRYKWIPTSKNDDNKDQIKLMSRGKLKYLQFEIAKHLTPHWRTGIKFISSDKTKTQGEGLSIYNEVLIYKNEDNDNYFYRRYYQQPEDLNELLNKDIPLQIDNENINFKVIVKNQEGKFMAEVIINESIIETFEISKYSLALIFIKCWSDSYPLSGIEIRKIEAIFIKPHTQAKPE